MPVYDFHCDDCECDFEVDYAIDDDRGNLECPNCQSKNVLRVFTSISTDCSGKSKSSDSCSKKIPSG
ncbi:MAG: FmdB family zinc ribbon protein [bacterium]